MALQGRSKPRGRLRMETKDNEKVDEFSRRWRERFEGFAREREDEAGIAGWSQSGLSTRLRSFEKLWKPREAGEKWLDAGCGAGTYTRFLQAQGLDVFAIDYSEPTIRKARDKAPFIRNWIVADLTRLPVRKGSFNGAICLGVTQALSGSDQLIQELSQSVGPQGEIWVDGLNKSFVPHRIRSLWRRLSGKPVHVRYESDKALAAMLEDRGFNEIEVHWLFLTPHSMERMRIIFESGWFQASTRRISFLGRWLAHSFVVRAARPPADGPESDE